MRLQHFASALSAVSLLSFAAAACSERAAEPTEARPGATAEPAPPIEASALPEDARPPASEAVPVALGNAPG